MADIELDDVSVSYPDTDDERAVGLDHVDLHVRSGELLTLIGPSGSGKSTLLRTIAGLIDPDEGTVRIDGDIVNGMPPRDRDVALVAQYDTLLPHLTVEQNLGFPLSLRNVDADETSRRVGAEARTLGLWSKLRRRPRQLSTGERQKAALGRATTRRPRAYLFDEPLAGLDAGERGRVRRELRQLQKGMGITAIYVTHDQRDAMSLGDRVAVMSRGRVAQVDEPMQVYADPVDLFVARFFGNPPMGVLQGRLVDDGTTAWIDIAGTALRLHPAQRSAVTARGSSDLVAIGVRTGAVRLASTERPVVPADSTGTDAWLRRIPTIVASVEPLGATTIVVLRPPDARADGANTLYAAVPPTQHVQRGAHVDTLIDMRDGFLFDGLTGRRIAIRAI